MRDHSCLPGCCVSTERRVWERLSFHGTGKSAATTGEGESPGESSQIPCAGFPLQRNPRPRKQKLKHRMSDLSPV